jgi:hypothetical protein
MQEDDAHLIMIKVAWRGVGGGRVKEINFVGWPTTGRHHTYTKKSSINSIAFLGPGAEKS